MKKIYKIIKLMVLASIIGAGVQSCGNSKKKEETKMAQELIKQEIKELTYPLPSMFELTEMLNNIEASYIVTLSNDPSKAKNYHNEQLKAINLGIYAADLAYATTYNSQAEVQTYFEACETLVGELDLTSAFDKNLPDNIKSNINNRDKLIEIVSGIMEKSYSYLNEQGRQDVSYLILTGTVIEGMYLATNISANAYQNPEIIKAILHQKEALVKLQELMEKNKNNTYISEAYKNIETINNVYGMSDATSMTQTQVEKLTELVRNIRDKYIQ